MITPQFADLLRSNSEAVVQKVQMHLPSYNYNTRDSRVCSLDFPQPILAKSKIDLNGTIWLK